MSGTIGGIWWGGVLWSGAPAGSYQSHSQSISRTPITLVQLHIDKCARSFGVAPCVAAGTACYNTYHTCKNRANYSRTVNILEYVTVDAGVPFHQGERPYVLAVDYLPTEISNSLTVSGRCKITIADEPDTDYGIDPSIATRTKPVPGMYWKKFLARNPNYEGRTVKIWEGFAGLTRSGFELRWQGVIDNITYSGDRVVVEAVDTLKPIKDYCLPEKKELALYLDLTTLSTELAVRLSSGLSTYSYYRLNDEAIQINSYNSALDSVNVTRAVLGTQIDEHRAGDKLTPIWHRGPENPFDTMLFISSFCGVSSIMNTTAWTAAKNWPGDDQDIETYISEPQDCDKLLFELAELTNCRIWYNERQKIDIRRISPNDVSRTYTSITDHAHIIEDSVSVDYRATDRLSRVWMYWGQSAMGVDEDSTSYAYLTGAIDAEAESSVYYDKIAERTIYNRWSHSSDGPGYTDAVKRARSYCERILFNRRDPLPMLTMELEIKDSTILTGQYLQIDTDEIESITGAHSNNKYLCVYRDNIGDGKIKIKAQSLPTRNLCVIGSTTAAGDWTAASSADRNYGYICDSSGYLSDGETLGYHIY